MKTPLNISNHNRDASGMTYVYPVVSRRAGGVSIGINLNPNSACNWRCIYCQVPDLTRGNAPSIDLDQLDRELHDMLQQIVHGNFMQQRVEAGARHLEDIAFSGNGEPTTAKEFPQAIQIVARALKDFGLLGQLKVRLITNGSRMDRPEILEAIAHLARCNGEVWFKVDAATQEGMASINDVALNPQGVLDRLIQCSTRCPTWVQTCMFALDDHPPSAHETSAWLALIASAAPHLAGVHLYGLARPSMQPEAPRLSRLSEAWMEQRAEQVRALGLTVKVSP
jgi:wyosine [tRNA(Phe)-imidazoG37] synthetase (radical SAM superfamily)